MGMILGKTLAVLKQFRQNIVHLSVHLLLFHRNYGLKCDLLEIVIASCHTPIHRWTGWVLALLWQVKIQVLST